MESATATIEIPLEVKQEFEILAKERGQDIQSFIIDIVKGDIENKDLIARRKQRKSKKKYNLVSMVGAGRHLSSFEKGTSEEINNYIRDLRKEWKY